LNPDFKPWQRSLINFSQRKKWFLIIAIVLVVFIAVAIRFIFGKANANNAVYDLLLPDCPADLSGLLTSPIIPVDSLQNLTPLGNSNPPGHTFPVDHVYFNHNIKTSPATSVYVPGNGRLIKIQDETGYDASGIVMRHAYLVEIALCKGVAIQLSANADLSPEFSRILQNTSGQKCKEVGGKHDNEKTIKQCSYEISVAVNAGDLMLTTTPGDFPEVWAFNYNTTPRSDVDWKRYDYSDYPYAFCLFDLYQGELKDQYYSKFGLSIIHKEAEKEKAFGQGKQVQVDQFVPRTIKPICGEINQNRVGTVQGDWFGASYDPSLEKTSEYNGTDLALIHSNFNPTYGRLTVGGNIISSAGVFEFIPNHTGTYNREFSEVTAGGSVYCYDGKSNSGDMVEAVWTNYDKKFLLQLTDNCHLKIEAQDGTCGLHEKFVNPITYDR